MVTIYDINPNDLIESVAKDLSAMSEVEAPEWTVFSKTGVHKERPPARDDWWHIRCAAVLRKVAVRGPVGTSKLRTLYGGKKDRGVKPKRFRRGSGSVARKVLQQLENAGLIKQREVKDKKERKGRILTPKGQALLDKHAKVVNDGKVQA